MTRAIPFPEQPSLPSAGSAAWIQDICLDSVGALRTIYRQGGDFVAYPNGPDSTFFAFTPEHNRTVLGDPDTWYIPSVPGPRKSSQRRYGLGLFSLNGERHLHHRRLMLPAFRKENAASYFEAVTELVDHQLGRWHAGQVLNIDQEMKELALKVTGHLLLGLEEFPLAREIARVIEIGMDAQISVLFGTVLPVEPPAGSYERLLEQGTELEQHLRALLRFRRSTFHEDQKDLLALLLQAHDQGRLSEDEVIGEMQSLINAAYQTTASALTWTLLLLAQHPEAAQGLVEELEGHSDLPGAHSQLERVIKESLRILPPAVFSVRQAHCQARLGSLSLPPGAVVILSDYITHHMPSLFAEPEKFQPDRWRTLTPSPYAYFPFSAGRRMCLGAAFSQQTLRVVIATVMRRFRLTVLPGSRLDRHSNVVLQLRQRLPMSVHSQDRRFICTPVLGNIHEMVDLAHTQPASKAA